jgi:hypothetical protein
LSIHCPYNEPLTRLEEVDRFVADTFHDNERVLYKSSPIYAAPQNRRKRTLYFADESDVILSKLSIDNMLIGSLKIAKIRDEI